MSPQEKLARTVKRQGRKRYRTQPGDLYSQPDGRPIRKVEFGSLAAALTSVVLGVISGDTEVLAAGLGSTVAFAITAYVTRSTRRG